MSEGFIRVDKCAGKTFGGGGAQNNAGTPKGLGSPTPPYLFSMTFYTNLPVQKLASSHCLDPPPCQASLSSLPKLSGTRVTSTEGEAAEIDSRLYQNACGEIYPTSRFHAATAEDCDDT